MGQARAVQKKIVFFLPVFVIVAFSFIATYPLLSPGFFSLHDELHVVWLYEMDRILAGWQIPPRWVPDLSFNFGYPLFNFVFPLPFYLGEIFHILGFSFTDSIKALFFISVPASGLAMYLFLRRIFGSFASIIGSIIYMFTPFRAVDIYVRGALGEVIAFIFIPLVFWATLKTIQEKTLKSVSFLGLFVAGLILAHNIASLMVLPVVGFFGVLMGFSQRNRLSSLVHFFGGLALGGAISAYFWLPAMIERKYMISDTVFNVFDHFPFIKQLILPSWGYGASVPGPNDGLSFQIGVVNLIVIFFTLVIAVFQWRRWNKMEKILLLFFLLIFFSACFLMNIRSSFIWKVIPLLPYFQFPWRFLILTTFTSAVIVGFFISALSSKLRSAFGIFLIVLAIVLTWNYFKPGGIKPGDDNYYLRRYTPNRSIRGELPTVDDYYRGNTEEYLRLPKNTKAKPQDIQPIVTLAEGSLKFSFDRKSPTHFKIETVGGPAKIFINNYYFPGWQALIDGQKAKIEIGQPYGQMMLNIPEGRHVIRVFFSETTFRLMVDFVSAASFFLSLSFCWSGMLQKLLLRLKATAARSAR